MFDAILEKAHTLCGADHGALATFDGKAFRAIATRGLPEAFAELLRRGMVPYPGSPLQPLVRGEHCVHIADMAALVAESPLAADGQLQTSVELAGTRTLLIVPLRKDGVLLGYIAAYRQPSRSVTIKSRCCRTSRRRRSLRWRMRGCWANCVNAPTRWQN